MSDLRLEDLRIEAVSFSSEQSLESVAVGQGINEVGASLGPALCCTYACCSTDEQ